jgi:hypothetical protein
MNGLQIGKNNDIYIIGTTNAEDYITLLEHIKKHFKNIIIIMALLLN